MPKHPLRAWRDHQLEPFTQQRLADAAGVSKSMIADIERGAREPSLGVAAKLSDITGLDVRAFLRATAAPGEPRDMET